MTDEIIVFDVNGEILHNEEAGKLTKNKILSKCFEYEKLLENKPMVAFTSNDYMVVFGDKSKKIPEKNRILEMTDKDRQWFLKLLDNQDVR
ncbi:MAG: hypothetical protein CL489_09335 [Acidobacteria bacterium]|nr:hypothetical protein [Acidobacteriota bacterium]|tara:strand:+ start:814 stop:1086 length:273 start_codon:yes stop_codon:yes gene_type:complete